MDYEMFTTEGNEAIAKVVANAREEISTGKLTCAELTQAVMFDLRMVQRVYEEATDTAVVDAVFAELNK